MRTLFRLSRPLYILLAALTYCFGVSIANYLGKPFRADAFWLGLGWCAGAWNRQAWAYLRRELRTE